MAITWCGKRMWKSIRAIPTSTLGYEKMFNWAFRCNEESDFISTLLTGQPEPPKYFSLMKNLNKYGPPIRKKRKSTAINTVEELQEILKSVYQIVDIRDVESFCRSYREVN